MEHIYENHKTHNYEIDITTEEWIKILSLPIITKKADILNALEKWYYEPNQTSSCKALSQKYGESYQNYSTQNKLLGKIAIEYLNRFDLIRENGKEAFWAVAWIELRKDKGTAIVKLRPELVKAIEIMGLFDKQSSQKLHESLQNYVFNDDESFTYTYQKKAKPEKKLSEKQYETRNAAVAVNALRHSGHKCEFDDTHKTFLRKSDGKPYLETHHLIPLAFSYMFEYSIDIPENIVCLCSLCHDCIHYGSTREIIIKRLFDLRKDDLQKAGINISLNELLSLYNITV